jgi:hypothetical protein
MILKVDPDEIYNEADWMRKQSTLKTRQISAKLDKINTHINAINSAFEDIVELYQKSMYEHDDLADVVLARIARKYEHIFDVWSVFIAEDIVAIKDITTRCNKFKEKLQENRLKTTRTIDLSEKL